MIGASLSGRILPNNVLQDIGQLSPTVKVIINNGEYTSHLTADGVFKFPLIRDGSHVLQILDAEYEFHRVRLDVHGKSLRASLTQSGFNWARTSMYIGTPLEVLAIGKLDFFKKREQFNILSLLSNPMILMSGVTMILFFLLPKMTEGMDPEALKEIQKQQQESVGQMPKLEMPDVSEKLANYFASSSTKSVK